MSNSLSAAAMLAVLTLFYAACTVHPYARTNKMYRKQSRVLLKEIRRRPEQDSLMPPKEHTETINFNLRKPNYVIIHYTAQNSCEQTLRTFTVTHSQVSAHYVICKDGTVHHMLNDYLRAWHAGNSRWGNSSDINSSSIGIEIDNNGLEPYTNFQIYSLLRVLEKLKTRYNIPEANFIGHSDIAPGRKIDPGRAFPWALLAASRYGLWYDTTGVEVPPGFNAMQALRIIGYSVQDTASAIRSFKLHFVQNDSTEVLNEQDHKILTDLMRKY